MTTAEPSDPRSDWTAPGAEDLGGEVFRIPLPLPNDGLRAVNVYVLGTPDGLLLIDGGWAIAESAAQLRDALAGIGFGLDEITRFLVTHSHRDHYTQAIALRRETGATVSLGAGEQVNLERIRYWHEHGRPSGDFTQLRRSGADALLAELTAAQARAPRSADDDWELPDSWLQHDEVVPAGARRLRVIATPGHTQGHVVFHDEIGGLLFAGDHVLPHITPSIGFEPVRSAFPLRDYLDSLRLMHQLPDARLLPAHGPVTGQVHERVSELLVHHEVRLDDSATVVLAGAATAFEAARALTWTRRRRRFDSLDIFNQMLAVSETAAHLDVLVLQGRLSSATDPDGVEIYLAPAA